MILLYICFPFCFIFPKNKKIVLFGGWFGKKFADSPKVLFDYSKKNNTGYKTYFYIKDKSLFKKIKIIDNYKKAIIYYHSLKGLWIQLRAKTLVCCIGPESDFNPYLFGGKIIILYPHGISAKTPKEDNIQEDVWSKRYRKMKSLYSKFNKAFYISPSSYLLDSFMNFHKWIKHFYVQGLPEYDVFFDNDYYPDVVSGIRKQYSYVFSYLPTHRQEGNVEFPMKDIFDFDDLNEFLIKTNSLLIIKKHFYHSKEKNITGYSNIVDVTNSNLELSIYLKASDAVVSDYSSTAFVFLFLNKPVINYVFDLDSYLKNDRKSFVPVKETFFGPAVSDYVSLKKEMMNCINGVDNYKKIRDEYNKKYFDKSISYPCSEYFFEYILKNVTNRCNINNFISKCRNKN